STPPPVPHLAGSYQLLEQCKLNHRMTTDSD
ncbi:MAG: hypothetical protein ACI9XK_002975, partial [Granulosicoccus sp.]